MAPLAVGFDLLQLGRRPSTPSHSPAHRVNGRLEHIGDTVYLWLGGREYRHHDHHITQRPEQHAGLDRGGADSRDPIAGRRPGGSSWTPAISPRRRTSPTAGDDPSASSRLDSCFPGQPRWPARPIRRSNSR